jgi:hypothetical protein
MSSRVCESDSDRFKHVALLVNAACACLQLFMVRHSTAKASDSGSDSVVCSEGIEPSLPKEMDPYSITLTTPSRALRLQEQDRNRQKVVIMTLMSGAHAL